MRAKKMPMTSTKITKTAAANSESLKTPAVRPRVSKTEITLRDLMTPAMIAKASRKTAEA